MDKRSLVSIVIPAYNAERFIRRSLDSALGQRYSNVEVLVSDDGSTDGTADIVKSYHDSRLRYLYHKNGGQGFARNAGIREASGEFIAFLDADDYYLPAKVEMQVGYLQQHPEYQIAYSNALHFFSAQPDRFLKKKRPLYPSGDLFPELLRSSLINLNTLMIRRNVLQPELLFSEGVEGRYCDEWDFYLRLSRAGNHFGWLDADVAVVEIRSDSHTQWDIQWKMKKALLNVLQNLPLTDEEKQSLRLCDLLRTCKKKLAIAYLVNRRKRDFFATIKEVYSVPVSYLMGGVAFLVPSQLLRASLIGLWKLKQQRSFCQVDGAIGVR
jgi:glycosyltransferase involved in cell wall biosynthesis